MATSEVINSTSSLVLVSHQLDKAKTVIKCQHDQCGMELTVWGLLGTSGVKAIISLEWERSAPCSCQGDRKGSATRWTQISLKHKRPLLLLPNGSECQMILFWETVKLPSRLTAGYKSPHLVWLILETIEYVTRCRKHHCNRKISGINKHGSSFKAWFFFLIPYCTKMEGTPLSLVNEHFIWSIINE